MLPPPIRPETGAGYVQFRGFNALAILLSVWALASATGFARGDEERGIVESTLAAGVSRIHLIASHAAAFAIGSSIAAAAAAVGLLAAADFGHQSVGASGLPEASAQLVAVMPAC